MQRAINIHNTKAKHSLNLVFYSLSVAIIAILGSLFATYSFSNMNSALAEGNTVDFSIESTDSISVSVPSTPLVLALKTSAEGQFGRAQLDVDVSTNSATGYSLTMLSSSNRLTRDAKVNNTEYYIDSLGSSITCTDETDNTCTGFTVNKWGFRVSTEAAYSSVPTTTDGAEIIKTTTGPANSDITTIYFGAKLDSLVPVGSYSGVTLTFAATINPETLAATTGEAPASDNTSTDDSSATESPASSEVTTPEDAPTETTAVSETSN